MLRNASYGLCLAAWIGAALLYPRWTGRSYPQQSSSGDQKLVRLQMPVYPPRAPLWNPPGFLGDRNATPVRWPSQPAPAKDSYVEIAIVSVAAQVTAGVLALALISGWSYPFRERPPDYTAGIALGGAHGLVWGWFVVAGFSVLLSTPYSRQNADLTKVSVLAAAFLLGSARGAWSTRRIRQVPEVMNDALFGGSNSLIVQVSVFSGAAMLGGFSLSLLLEAAAGLSRYFGWPLTKDPAFGTYANAPALDTAAFLFWIAMLCIAWIRWRRGPRAFAVGLVLGTFLGGFAGG